MPFTLRIRGQRLTAAERGAALRPGADDSFRTDNPLFRIGEEYDFDLSAARSADQPPEELEIATGHALARITMGDGQVIWLTYERLQALLQSSEGSALELGSDSLSVRGTADRGLLGLGIKALKLIGIDLKQAATEISTKQLIAHIEGKLHGNQDELKRARLYRCHFGQVSEDPADILIEEIVEPLSTDPDLPMLVLLHGTFSTTQATFGDLWGTDAKLRDWRQATEAYDGRVYALEHATLSASPQQNAADLLALLPTGQRLHLLSHSRGGLVGEILCRDPSALPARHRAQLSMPAVDDLLTARRIRVDRFVRVACPGAGTFLADDKIDVWLGNLAGGLNRIIGWIPAPGLIKELIEGALALMCAIAQRRSDSELLPGLEAMRTQSSFIRKLNLGPRSVSELRVVSGDADIAGIGNLGQTLATLLADRYWEGLPNDLVVETASMTGGAQRTTPVLVAAYSGGKINHFSYFHHQRTFDAVVQGLRADDPATANFLPLSAQPAPTRAASRAPQRRDRPHIVMLPGFAGSHLAHADNRIWLDFWSLVWGEFDQLAYTPGASQVQPDGWLGRYYDDLADDLRRQNFVIDLPFDWRLSLAANADILARRLRDVMASAHAHHQPIRLLAHSIGGMVTLYLINHDRPLWRELVGRYDARCVMAGSPIRGTHRAMMLLTGQHELLNLLASVDMTASRRELVKQMSEMPGLLEALPRWGVDNLFRQAVWQDLHRQDAAGREHWQVPDQVALSQAEQIARILDERPDHTERILYLAGQDTETPDGYTIGPVDQGWFEERQRPGLVYTGSSAGDGLALWDQIPGWANVRYLPGVAHGDLFDTADYFPAITDLLLSGTTGRRLPAQPPSPKTRADRATEAVTPSSRYLQPAPIAVLPDQAALEAAILHAKGRARRRDATLQGAGQAPRCRVRVLHGNLVEVAQPLVLGHYQDDPIAGSAKAVDDKMHGALERFRRHGIFPGTLGSCEIIHDPQSETHTPAIVVGLGRPGELSAHGLRRTLTNALVRFGLHMDEHHRHPGLANEVLTISTLLIGSYYLRVDACVQALVMALDSANQHLADLNVRTIGELSIVELFEEPAICAVQALHNLGDRLPRSVEFTPYLQTGTGEQYARAPRCDNGEWWRRLLIDGRYQSLTFTPLTERAGIPVEIKYTDRVAIDKLLASATQSTVGTQDIDAALYELLIPAPFKERMGRDSGLVLVVDQHSARYPWEMLRDQFQGDNRPITADMGLLRQLRMDAYLTNDADNATSGIALVVGDPHSDFPPLPGAQMEAEAVQQVLERQGLRSELLNGASGVDILKRILLSDCQLLHLAGHGVFDWVPDPSDIDADSGEPQAYTGMVLGDGIYFGPQTVKSIRHLPEFVFINCCHLGNVGDKYQQLSADRHRLAANLGTQFIANGVKAVIAAGWAVNDQAAQAFAETFYGAFVTEGGSFGESVLLARQHTYAEFPRINTWGAYQCYGEPHFRLSGEGRGRRSTPARQAMPVFHARSQLVRYLRDLAAQPSVSSQSSAAQVQRQIATLLPSVPAAWRDAPDVLEAHGALLGELGQFAAGIEKYEQAQRCETASISLRAIEQKNNLLIRHAVHRASAAMDKGEKLDAAARKRLLQTVDQALADLERLLTFGVTTERLSLLGSARKHRALLHGERNHEAVENDLEEAADFYRRAEQRKREIDAPDLHYPALNRLTAQVLGKRLKLARNGPARPTIEYLQTEIATIAETIDRLDDPDFWALSDRVNCEFLSALVANGLENTGAVDRLARRYLEVGRYASARQFDSIRQQFRYCRRIMDRAKTKRPDHQANLAALDRLYALTKR